MLVHRVRQNIRDGHPNFIISEDSWPAFLYPIDKYDPDNIEKGLFKSAILLKVFTDYSICQGRDTITSSVF